MTTLQEAWRAHCATCNENAQLPFDSFAAGFAAGQDAEREACAKVCEEMDVERTNYCMHIYEEGEQYKSAVIAAIRARGSAAPTVHNPAGIHDEDVS